jgi:alkanesulfonate monooxygenase SsuD/methylene tetrahydromethanopterin reductase-like flavin-dependent oxidoreductase (luciferase family)
MKYDIFFSISQTPVNGTIPSEREMYANFFEQVVAADELGYGTAWIAESHLSSEVQKGNKRPVIPHWKGEVGLNTDFLQLSHQIFKRTKRIETGAAVMNILCMGGPIAHAERVGTFLTLHGMDPEEARRINVGFAAGRFDFMNEASGIVPRNAWEAACGRVLKNKIFDEAGEIFCRLLRGETLCSDDISVRTVSRSDFRSDEDWDKVCTAYGSSPSSIELPRRWEFEKLKIVPSDFRRDLLSLIIGSHSPATQDAVNQYMPVKVFNLSITQPEVIEATHERMSRTFHPDGGAWEREHMPRTTFVFLNEEDGLDPAERSTRAHAEAREALGEYWKALQGTLDPEKVEKAATNALIGNAEEIAAQMIERFHPDDRLMLWFDFFNHDSARVVRNMEKFMSRVAPLVAEHVTS